MSDEKKRAWEKLISIRLSEQQLSKLFSIADSEGKSAAAVVRRLAEDVVAGKPPRSYQFGTIANRTVYTAYVGRLLKDNFVKHCTGTLYRSPAAVLRAAIVEMIESRKG